MARARFAGRNWRYRPIFDPLRGQHLGAVLDVGGGALFDAVGDGLRFDSWTVVEPDPTRFGTDADPRLARVQGDGTRLPVRDGAYDTVLSIQVLEHVFDPMAMATELRRVTRPGGRLVVVVPQTANVHELPHHYQNLTRYWLDEMARRLELDVIEYRALGGAWSSLASRQLFHYATALRVPGHHEPTARRGWRFWALFPLGLAVSAITFPLAMLLSLADVEEEANNHLMVLRRPLTPDRATAPDQATVPASSSSATSASE